jgi:hypothetical protein
VGAIDRISAYSPKFAQYRQSVSLVRVSCLMWSVESVAQSCYGIPDEVVAPLPRESEIMQKDSSYPA